MEIVKILRNERQTGGKIRTSAMAHAETRESCPSMPALSPEAGRELAAADTKMSMFDIMLAFCTRAFFESETDEKSGKPEVCMVTPATGIRKFRLRRLSLSRDRVLAFFRIRVCVGACVRIASRAESGKPEVSIVAEGVESRQFRLRRPSLSRDRVFLVFPVLFLSMMRVG